MPTQKEHLKIYDEDFPLFVEAGFVAIKQCDEQSAIRLFSAAYMLRPDHAAPHLGLGYLYLNLQQLDRAIACLERSLQRDPSLALTKALLGGAFVLSKREPDRANALLDEVSKESDPDARKMAEVWMKVRDKLAEKASQQAQPAR